MSDGEPTTTGAQRSPELEELHRGLRMGEFFAMDDAAMERAVQLLLADDRGVMGVNALSFLEELDRRATKRHTEQVEIYARRLDRFTRWLLAFTIVIVLQTTALIGLEIEAHYAGAGWPAALATLMFTGGVFFLASWIDSVVIRRWQGG